VALGRATVTVGEVDDATTVFRRAISLQPKDSSARLGLANALASQGEVDSAIGEYRLGISLWVPMTRMLTTIFPICSNEREISTVRLQNTVWDCSWIPRMATAAATWACYQIKKGDLDGAIEKMRLALTLWPRNTICSLPTRTCARKERRPGCGAEGIEEGGYRGSEHSRIQGSSG
jgi:tetratricopeptide (TPR) repeat protein